MKFSRIIEKIISIIFTIIYLVPALIFALAVRFFKNKKHKLLICGIETSANIKNIAEVLYSSKQYQVSVFQFYENKNYKLENHFYNYFTIKSEDSIVKKYFKAFMKCNYIFISLIRYDIIFFNWTESFLFLNLDYIFFYLSKKIIIVRHCGDDVRYRPLQNNIHTFYNITQWSFSQNSILDLVKKAWRQRIAEKFTLVMSTRDHATFQGRDLLSRPYIQKKLIKTNGFNRVRPLIIHAPSDPKIKGTKYVLEAIEMLKETNLDFDFELCYGLDNAKLLTKLNDCIILIDQPGAVPARLAVEGLASGCVIVGGNIFEINNQKNCPIIQFESNSHKLFKIIYNLLNDIDNCKKISNLSYKYWEENFSEKAFLEYFANLIDSKFIRFSLNNNHIDLLKKGPNKWYENLILKILY